MSSPMELLLSVVSGTKSFIGMNAYSESGGVVVLDFCATTGAVNPKRAAERNAIVINILFILSPHNLINTKISFTIILDD